MSRIGKLPISIPAGIDVSVSDANVVTVKGKLGELSQQVDAKIAVKVEDGNINLERSTDEKAHRAMHGLYRSLINNMVTGVSEGYTIKQEFVGVGFKVIVEGQLLEMSLGYSHSIFFELPAEVKAEALAERGKNPVLTLKSHDKQLLGQVAAKIRAMRKPEPYKGKGVKFVGEELRKKAGKSAEK